MSILSTAIKGFEFECTRDNLQINGMQYVPADFDEAGSYPAIIFSHGFTDNYHGMEQFCKDFAGMGYVTFCFNFCGGGTIYEEENHMRSGKTTDMSVMTEVADLTAVMEYARNLPYVDRQRLTLAGGSQGGFVSGLTATRNADKVCSLVMIFPALCIPDHARMGHLGGSTYDPANVPEVIDCGNSRLGRHFHEEVSVMDTFLELSAYKGPVLILQGLDDRIVNYSYAIRAKENYEKGQCHLQLIRNMGHGLNEEQHNSAAASIRQFMNGRKEILTIRVIITHTESEASVVSCINHSKPEDNLTNANCNEPDAKQSVHDIQKNRIYFTGYCETEYFTGSILPEGCDTQEFTDGVQTGICAEYTLDGLDMEGAHCTIHIVNQRGEVDFEPTIQTDSKALAWLNEAKLTAVLEGGEGGPTVRIYADANTIPIHD